MTSRRQGVQLPKVAQELAWLVRESREHLNEILIPEMAVHGFAEHAAEIGSEREIAAFIQLRLIEARPTAKDFSAFHRSSHHEHHVGVAMIGAAVTVFPCSTTEFGHRDHHSVIGQIAE